MRLASILLLVSLLVPIVAAGGQPFFNQTAVEPGQEIINQVSILMGLIVPFMVTMMVLAAAVYVGGQFFGAETRAKATVWSMNMLAAVGVSALIIVMLYAVLPSFFTGQIGDVLVAEMIEQIKDIAQMSLIGLIMLFVVLAAGAFAMGQMFGAETRARAAVWATALFTGAIVCSVIFALLFLIIEPMTNAIASSQYIGVVYATVIVNIVLGVSFIILITYLAAKIFKVAEWEAYLNIELSNLMGTFLLVVFLLGLFAIGNLVAMSFSGTAASPPQAAIEYIQGTVASSALRAMIDVYKIQACTSMLSTFSRRIGEFVLTQTYKVFPGIDTFVQISNVLTFSLLTLYNTASVQVTLLHLADALMLKFFLPAGIILRFFPPTRDAGAFLIALAFGFQVVFPTTYMINKEIYESIGGEPYTSPSVLIQSLCGPFKFGVAGFLLNPSANPLFGLLPGGTAAAGFLSKLVSESFLNAISMAEFVPIMRYIASLSLLSLFMPALSMMVTIAFINSMTKFIVYKV